MFSDVTEKEVQMPLKIEEVIAKVNAQKDPSLGLVKDGPIYYLVLNKEDYLFNKESIIKLEEALTQLENAEEGPACLVTIGAGKKKFSTGFDLAYWAANPTNSLDTLSRMIAVYKRLITLPMPTMCVFSGHAFAAGLLFSLTHDFRLMLDKPKPKVCFTEISIGMALPPAYAVLPKMTLTPETNRVMQLGARYNCKQALQMGIVSGLFSDLEDAERQI